MPRCPKCDVDLAPDAAWCPLCGTTLDPSREAGKDGFHDAAAEARLTEGERRKVAAELLTASILIPAVAVSAVNILVSGRISWGLYPLLSLALVWVLLGSILGLFGRRVLALLPAALALPLFLLGLDLADGLPLSWSLSIGLPIALLCEAVAGLVFLVAGKSRRRGANVPAFVTLGLILACLGIEATIDLATAGRLSLEWSAIVAFALAPIAAFLFYLHLRLTRTSSLRKLFRL